MIEAQKRDPLCAIVDAEYHGLPSGAGFKPCGMRLDGPQLPKQAGGERLAWLHLRGFSFSGIVLPMKRFVLLHVPVLSAASDVIVELFERFESTDPAEVAA